MVLPGYSLVASPTLGTTSARECPQDTFRSGEATVNASSAATPCEPCGGGMVTLPNVTRATTPDACLIPPGYGWVDLSNNTAGRRLLSSIQGYAQICARGYYNPGYNRQPCIK